MEAINIIFARARTLPAPAGRPLVTKTILIGQSFGAYTRANKFEPNAAIDDSGLNLLQFIRTFNK